MANTDLRSWCLAGHRRGVSEYFSLCMMRVHRMEGRKYYMSRVSGCNDYGSPDSHSALRVVLLRPWGGARSTVGKKILGLSADRTDEGGMKSLVSAGRDQPFMNMAGKEKSHVGALPAGGNTEWCQAVKKMGPNRPPQSLLPEGSKSFGFIFFSFNQST